MGVTPLPEPEGPTALVERLRSVHLEMLDAVLSGDGLERVAEIAASETGGAIAIVLPRSGATVVAPADEGADRRPELHRYVSARLRDRPARVPEGIVGEVPVSSGDDPVGAVLLVGADEVLSDEAAEFMHLAAIASLTEVAIEEAREEVEHNLRGSFLEDLRERPELEPGEIVRRGQRLGCDLSTGAIALCAELESERPRHVVAMIAGEHHGALAQHMGDRVYALLPAGSEGTADATMEAGRRLATRLQRHGPVGLSSFYADPAEIPRAIGEAELVLDVMRQSDLPITEDIGAGAYRLLFRVLASHPEEVRSFYESTVAPIVAYDEQYRTDLTGTLEAYLEHNCSIRATAAAIYAHRHTVSYRLERVKELTGLDATLSEDRERLGLGLKAYRIIAPQLPR